MVRGPQSDTPEGRHGGFGRERGDLDDVIIHGGRKRNVYVQVGGEQERIKRIQIPRTCTPIESQMPPVALDSHGILPIARICGFDAINETANARRDILLDQRGRAPARDGFPSSALRRSPARRNARGRARRCGHIPPLSKLFNMPRSATLLPWSPPLRRSLTAMPPPLRPLLPSRPALGGVRPPLPSRLGWFGGMTCGGWRPPVTW